MMLCIPGKLERLCNTISEKLYFRRLTKNTISKINPVQDYRYYFFTAVMDKKKRVHLFNCDKTYDLLVVEALLRSVGEKLPFTITISKHYFSLKNMAEICDNTISKLTIDFAFFVVHANESRLSINESNVDIGYTKVYRALLEATGGKVVVVIGGDSNYKDEDDGRQNVLSRKALRIVHLQLKEEFRDGRKSFVFSWNKKHRSIHEEALLHFFDPSKAGVRFVPQCGMAARPKSDTASASVEESFAALEVDGRRRQRDISRTAAKPRETADLMILCSDETVATVVSHMYCLPSMRPPPEVHIGSPTELKLHLPENTVRMSAIGLLANDLKEALLKNNWEKSAIADLLKRAQIVAEKTVIVIICSDRNVKELALSQSEEIDITKKVELILKKKGVILWERGRSRENESSTSDAVVAECQYVSFPAVEPSDTPKEELMLKTAIRYGVVSYKESDVVERKECWKPPPQLELGLLEKWKNVPKAELEIHFEKDSGHLRVVVKGS